MIKPVRGFKTLKTAYATIKGFEVMRALEKGQARLNRPGTDGDVHFQVFAPQSGLTRIPPKAACLLGNLEQTGRSRPHGRHSVGDGVSPKADISFSLGEGSLRGSIGFPASDLSQ